MRVDIGGGVRLFIDIDGLKWVFDGPELVERPTVLLLHGGPGLDHAAFKVGPLAGLSDIAQVVYYDHRGNGRSDGDDPTAWNLDTWADDVVRLCEALGIERPIVFGGSFGGMVAQRYLALHPEHPAKVILGYTTARQAVDEKVEAFTKLGGPEVGEVARRFWELEEGSVEPYRQICAPFYSTRPADPRLVGRALKTDVMRHFQRGEEHDMDLRPGLAAARCPVLVLGGELDPVCPVAMSREIAAALPPSLVELHIVPGASHRDVTIAAIDVIRAFVAS
ncbi:MAG: alpha/beta hydrolase [Acidimicrobiales bacterium]|nr:alpha/beta hydrolase [Acidimicrobiales bacterium]